LRVFVELIYKAVLVIKYHTTRTYERRALSVSLQTLSVSFMPFASPPEKRPSVHWKGNWMGPRTTLGMTVKRKISAPTGNETSEILQPIALSFLTHRLLVKGRVQATKAQRGSKRYSPTLSLTSALDVGGWSTPSPGRFTPGKDPVPIV
jgi:hypothetical protein